LFEICFLSLQKSLSKIAQDISCDVKPGIPRQNRDAKLPFLSVLLWANSRAISKRKELHLQVCWRKKEIICVWIATIWKKVRAA